MEPKLRSVLVFHVDDDAPHRALTEATQSALEAARRALPEGSGVEADGSLGRAADAGRRVKFELTLRASAAAGLAAERAFADAFLRALTAQGYDASRA